MLVLGIAAAVVPLAPGSAALADPGTIATVAAGGGVIAANPATNRIYVAQDPAASVAVIDGNTNSVATTVPTKGFHTGMAVNPQANRIYVSQQFAGQVRIIDGATDSVLSDCAPPGSGTIGGVAINTHTNLLYVVRFDQKSVAIADATTCAAVGTIPLSLPSVDVHDGIAINPISNRIYISNPAHNSITVIDGGTNTIVATIAVGSDPRGIDVNPVTSAVYVANYGSDTVTVIDGSTNTAVASVPVGDLPLGVAVKPGASGKTRIYVTNNADHTVSVIKGSTLAVLFTVPVGPQPQFLDVNPTTNRIYVSNDTNDTVTVIEDPSPGPVAVDDTAGTAEDTPLTVPTPGVLSNDTGDEPLTAALGTGPSHGTVTLNPDGSFTYLPAANFAGTDTFTYTATDGTTSSPPATVTVTVTAVNDAPVLDPIPAQNVRWGNLLTISAHASDVDIPADTLTYSLVDAPAGASIDPVTGAVSFTPTSAQVGQVTVTVRVDDGGSPNLFAETPITVTVQKRPTRLVYAGDSTGQFSDPVAVRATLTDDGGEALQGQPITARTVTFGIGAQNAADDTDPAGLAQTTVTLNQPAGSPGVSSTFTGDGLYLSSSDADPFTITVENATVAYTGPRVSVSIFAPIQLSGTVTEAADTSLGNRVDATQLRFTVRRVSNNAVVASCTSTVNPTTPGSGAGHCSVGLSLIGAYKVTVELVGNGFYTAPAVQSPNLLAVAL